MTKAFVNKHNYGLTLLVVLFTIVQLSWEYLSGGVVAHHLMARSDMPSFSNWWGILILPILAWLTAVRINRLIELRTVDKRTNKSIPNVVLVGLLSMLILSILQSISFEFGFPSITMYIAIGTLLLGLCLPIYRAECFLGHIMGATFTFGPVIPLIGCSVMAIISAISNLVIKPLLLKLVNSKNVG